MARTFWFAAGAGAGVYAMTRARRVREALTADGLRDRLTAWPSARGCSATRSPRAAGREGNRVARRASAWSRMAPPSCEVAVASTAALAPEPTPTITDQEGST